MNQNNDDEEDQVVLNEIKELARHEGELSLGDSGLSDAAAAALARHKEADDNSVFEGSILSLDGLTSLSDAAAIALARHEGTLGLSGLTSLSDAAAAALGGHKGWLTLSGLTSLSDAAAKALSRHQGSLHLIGLTSMSDVAVEALLSNGDVELPDEFIKRIKRE